MNHLICKMFFFLIIFLAFIDAQPTADVRENVRGEWINTTSGEHYKCSQCGTLAPIWIDESNSYEYYKDISEWLSNFCPNCGADMRGEKDA